jgi:two-component system chemotaxis sensor kinase CheA
MSIDASQFIPTFLEESFEGLDLMESSLLGLDAGDIDSVNAIFRAAHSIKGGAGTFGFKGISEFTHGVETLLDQLRDGRRQTDQPTVDLLLEAVDVLRDFLGAARDGEPIESDNADSVSERIQAVLDSPADAGGAAAKGGAVAASSAPAAAEPVVESEIDDDEPKPEGWKIIFTPHEGLLASGNDPARMFAVMEDLGELTVECDDGLLPGFSQYDPERCYLSWTLRVKGEEIPREQVEEVFEWVEDDCDLIIMPIMPAGVAKRPAKPAAPKPAAAEAVAAEPAKPAAEANKGAAKSTASKSRGSETTSIRVGIDKVDNLINNVGELVIIQSMLSQQSEQLEDFNEQRLELLKTGLAQLERHTRELQENVMKIRMLPISFAFNRFPRLVHDLSSKLGKKIELVLSGEQTELDKTVMEKIGDPLVHLVRNSLDHGIEPPAERVAAGKPETGTVELNAYHRGGNIIIEIKDDGGGINPEKVRAKAVANGLVSESQDLSEADMINLIFEPGFSTAAQVSDISGRGVGMDVVKRNIKDLGGSVEVKSALGEGSVFTIRLPLTLAILDGQLVRVKDQTYVVPLISIIESLQIEPAQLNAIAETSEMYRLREEYIPVLRLAEILGYENRRSKLEKKLLVVVEGDGKRAGMVVDELLGQQQVVVKSLASNFRPLDGISGATILGDGTVALIIDIAGIIQLGRVQQPMPAETFEATEESS